MTDKGALGRDLLAIATSTAIGAVGLAAPLAVPAAAAGVVATAKLVGEIVSNLALNYGAGKIGPLLGNFHSEDWLYENFDLDRVANLSLLCILYETLTEKQISEKDARQTVKAAGESWNLSIFRDASPTEKELVGFLREPCPMPDAQAQQLAQQILRHQSVYASLHAAYSQALSERFARTFEILLRNDERAFRAAVVYLQRLTLGDLKDLRAVLGDLREDRAELSAALDLLTRPQPRLRRYEGERATDKAPESTDLQFVRRAIRYRPREAVERSLIEGLESEEPFKILKITGPAGMGKSRLALELCDLAAKQHWHAGFVVNKMSWPDPWIPNRDTLAVVDYAASKQIGGRPAFDWLQEIFFESRKPQACPQGRPAKVRIVLLDRTDQGTLWTAWRGSRHAKDLDRLTVSILLTPDRTEFDTIVSDEFLRRKARKPSSQEASGISSLADRLRGQFRPLFASLTAAAVADPPPGTPAWSPEILIENMLYDQVRKWTEAGITDEELDLLFEATLTQGRAGRDWQERVERLSPAKLDALASLSDPTSDSPLGPILPDLLGEFFLLMRLRGTATAGDRQTRINIRAANEIVARSWQNETATLYIGRLLEDYLAWTPEDHAANPAINLMHEALAQAEGGNRSIGLRNCCFAAAWKKPSDRAWLEWLRRFEPDQALVVALAAGLYNSALNEPDPAQRREQADGIEKLYNDYGRSESLREMLALALTSVTTVEIDPAQQHALVDRIARLHEEHGQEPAVRRWLAQALHNAAVVEPDLRHRRELADRIEHLHEKYGLEAAVREQLAGALNSVAVAEPDPGQRRGLTDRIERLHEQLGREAAVRVRLARVLYSAAFVEPDPMMRRWLAERIDQLHEKYGQESTVREQLAKALCNAAYIEPDPALRRWLAQRIEQLHEKHGQESAVREQLARALCYAAYIEPDPALRRWLAQRIEQLHEKHGQESAVREQLARALYHVAFVELDPIKRRGLAERIERLHEEYGQEAAVRVQLANALNHAAFIEPELGQRRILSERIERLHEEYGQEPLVREQFARSLLNVSFLDPDVEQRRMLAERVEGLYNDYGREAEMRAQLAKTLVNVIVIEPDPAKRRGLAERVQWLYNNHGKEVALIEPFAKVLVNSLKDDPDPARWRALVERIERLHDDSRQEPEVRQALAAALMNAIVVEPDPAHRRAQVDRIEQLHNDFGQELGVRQALAMALSVAALQETDESHRASLIARLERLVTQYPDEPMLARIRHYAKTGEWTEGS